MTIVTHDTNIREQSIRYTGLFGPELYKFALLISTVNNRFLVQLGESSLTVRSFTYRTQAMAFLKEQNDLAKAEIERIVALQAPDAA